MSNEDGHSVRVGVFWYIKGHIYGEQETLNTKDYAIDGMVDSQLEHWRVWENKSQIINVPIERSDYEYFYFPRGRTLYDERISKYIVYCDKALMSSDIKEQISKFFGIDNKEVAWKRDLHYSTDENTISGLFEDGI